MSNNTYQCDDCKYARWSLYKECGYSMWEFDRCIKEDEIDEDEACGDKECHLWTEIIEEPESWL